VFKLECTFLFRRRIATQSAHAASPQQYLLLIFDLKISLPPLTLADFLLRYLPPPEYWKHFLGIPDNVTQEEAYQYLYQPEYQYKVSIANFWHDPKRTLNLRRLPIPY